MRPPEPAKEFRGLSNLMSTWLNQDYDIHGDTDEQRIYAYTSISDVQLLREIIREIEQLLALPTPGLLALYRAKTGMWNMMIGETDDDARRWLVRAHAVFETALKEKN